MTNMLHVEKQNEVVQITFNRPGRKNAFTNEMYDALADALNAADQDAATRVIVLTGAGGAFSAGNDLGEFISHPPLTYEAPVYNMLRALSSNKNILVAAVEGIAIGIGATLLLHCDLVLASSTATFQLPFINLGIVPEAASSLILPRLIGHQRSMELLLLAQKFDAQTAFSYGMVNRIVPSELLAAETEKTVEYLLEKPPHALHLIKRLVKSEGASISVRMREEAEALAAQVTSAEGVEAISALIEKRKPIF